MDLWFLYTDIGTSCLLFIIHLWMSAPDSAFTFQTYASSENNADWVMEIEDSNNQMSAEN